MKMRGSPRGDVTNKEWWTLSALGIGSVMKRWRNRYATNRPNTTRACRGGKDAVNDSRRSVRLKRSEMSIKIHPFRLPLLLINVRHPHQWCASRLECGKNLGDEQVRDHARVERTWAEHD
jgi:hypothetical protein